MAENPEIEISPELREEMKRFVGDGPQSDVLADALAVIFQYGQFDGHDHKAWALDQAARKLTGAHYRDFVVHSSFDEELDTSTPELVAYYERVLNGDAADDPEGEEISEEEYLRIESHSYGYYEGVAP